MTDSEQIPASPLTRKPRPRKPSRDIEVKRHSGAITLQDRGKFTQFGYRSAGQLTRDGTYAQPGSENWHVEQSRVQLVNQSLQFYRDYGLYRGMINRAVTNAVRGGFGHQARSGNKAWNEAHEKLWRDEFEQHPEVRGLFSWGECQAMALAETLKTGDHGAILVTAPKRLDGLIHMIESDRIVGGKDKDQLLLQGNGVKTDKYGRPTTFYIGKYNHGQVDASLLREISAEEFAWMALLDRPSQTRGMPACQAAFAMLHRISDVCDSEALAWQILSRLAIAVYRKDAGEWSAVAGATDTDKVNEDRSVTGEAALRVVQLDSALIFEALDPDDKVEGIPRNIPGQNFPDAIRMFMRLMGTSIGLPLELMLLDFSQTNYSSLRGSLEQAFAQFENLQRLLERWCRQVRNHWTDRMIARGRLTDRPDKHKHEWVKPAFPWLDALKEAQAWGAQLDRGLTTHAHAVKSLNHDRDELMAAREREVLNAIERAGRIEKETGKEVPWEIFAGLKPSPADPPAGETGAAPESAPDDVPAPRRPENEPRQPRQPKEID